MNRKSPSYTLLLFAAIMAILPFGEQPHLYQKIMLLKDGYLHKTEDWFDLLMHGGPLAGVLIYLLAKFIKSRNQDSVQ